ncbi:hypothetical protein [Sulfitobacter guttiformis]|uniref:Uncharacterized protein n=1 Tax=Sulfitobacter guttiformis TaxID=74349 RepID=A0A420DNM1_9RHOB|nr:hypothetical protein Z949_2384 [Sulfitobacter guttiformis KCTC 32187]RKE95876.1 hypothetical protein C8N30_0421 [Sulfitobacter guttiformis]
MLTRRGIVRAGAGALVGLGAAMAGLAGTRVWRLAQARKSYGQALPAPDGPLRVFHLGHSLVGRDMPAMVAQLAPVDHDFRSQLGWGTPLRAHWEPDVPVNGFDTENDHENFLPARDALEGAGFDAVVLTEMVELTDAIRYHDSAAYLARWAGLAREARPDVRLYLYETWHNTDDPAGWLNRIDTDFEALWMERVALPAAGRIGAPIYIVPGGQVLAAFVRAIEAQGGVGNIANRDALMARTPEGAVDTIHLSDLGGYLIALTHFAVLYQRSPLGLPLALMRADGTAAQAPDPQAGALMQEIVWDVVRANKYTGIAV